MRVWMCIHYIIFCVSIGYTYIVHICTCYVLSQILIAVLRTPKVGAVVSGALDSLDAQAMGNLLDGGVRGEALQLRFQAALRDLLEALPETLEAWATASPSLRPGRESPASVTEAVCGCQG